MICSAIISFFTALMLELVFRSFSYWLIADSCHPIFLCKQIGFSRSAIFVEGYKSHDWLYNKGSTSWIYEPITLSIFSFYLFMNIRSFVMICSTIISLFAVLMPECVFRSFSDWLIGDSCHPIGLLMQFDLRVPSSSWFIHLYASFLYISLPTWWVLHPYTLLLKLLNKL